MIETEISYDAVDPGIERALEAKARQVYVRPKKNLVINVLTILLRTSEMDGEAQHGAVILVDQFFEGGGVALLGLADKQRDIHGDWTGLTNLWPGGGKSSSIDICWSYTSFAGVTHDNYLRPHESSTVRNLRSIICPAYHDHSHVVLARPAASEVLGRTQHGEKRAASIGTTGGLCRSSQALCTELSTLLVSALRNTVGITQQCVARP